MPDREISLGGECMSVSAIRRLYVRKKPGFRQEEEHLCREMNEFLGGRLTETALYHRYDVEGLHQDEYQLASCTVFSEPPVDDVTECAPQGDRVIAVEYLPGQYDQRADSAEQCLAVLTGRDGLRVRCAAVYVLTGSLSEDDCRAVRKFLINPVESREASLDEAQTLALHSDEPRPVSVIRGLISFSREELLCFSRQMGLAMSLDDLCFVRDYFRNEEKRDPTVTEIRVIDTYWSDHCRHTTFSTELTDIAVEEGLYTAPIREALDTYRSVRKTVYGSGKNHPVTLMDMAVAAVKELRRRGLLQELDESEEVNACTIRIQADVSGRKEDWLLLFKNETHNHPTEIEPFGGAATCLGGCIRDPLSGRAYVYQAMRVTGSGDPRMPAADTLPGKLPQKTITVKAAAGYSSYGNQIGLATGEVREYYHPGFVAKRMEIGAVVAAAPADHVVRKEPLPGDAVILLGGKTGRDGCGGATGSSKELHTDSLETCGSEVQKGNPLTERKIQCLFRRKEATRLIKRCNDFGAGGVSVAIGELTAGVDIQLDKVPLKYEGLDGTELAISESQERMAVVLSAADTEEFMAYAAEENLEATRVASVTDTGRLVMHWRGQSVVDISRRFLDTNGVRQKKKALIQAPRESSLFSAVSAPSVRDAWKQVMENLSQASQQGLAERFDGSIGAASVLMPYGGHFQKTRTDGMAAKLPVLRGDTDTVSLMTHGYDPQIASWSPFHGAVYAVLLSLARITALGGNWRKSYLTLQEYFEKLTDEASWGKPAAALLGAFMMQHKLGVGAIGGKDSMSGTFNELHVPPTLVSFAVCPGKASETVSAEWKAGGHALVLFDVPRDQEDMPDIEAFQKNGDFLYRQAAAGRIYSMKAADGGGIAAAAADMAFGNHIGAVFDSALTAEAFFRPRYGAVLAETDPLQAEQWIQAGRAVFLGTLGGTDMVIRGEKISVSELLACAEKPLSKIFPLEAPSSSNQSADIPLFRGAPSVRTGPAAARPRVLIPVMPGTNCETDSARAFERAGALCRVQILRNRNQAELDQSVRQMAEEIRKSQIVMFPGGFSAGDEPEGSGKFIAALFRHPLLQEAMNDLLQQRDGLVLGICNGFQALIKLGLVPYGAFQPLSAEAPTLTYNTVGRHISRYVTTKVISVKSPWFSLCRPGDLYQIPVSHGEGRFVASDSQIQQWALQGQIATQYTDEQGKPSYDSRFNPNQSCWAVEGITSPDGRVLGKMGHSERCGLHIAKNIDGEKYQPLFASGVAYFSE